MFKLYLFAKFYVTLGAIGVYVIFCPFIKETAFSGPSMDYKNEGKAKNLVLKC
jgi:hypothetical protein